MLSQFTIIKSCLDERSGGRRGRREKIVLDGHMCCDERENEMQGEGMKEIGAGENEITNFRYRMSFS